MNIETAKKLLALMSPDNTRCPVCGELNPVTITLRNLDDVEVPCHRACPQDPKDIFMYPVETTVVLPSPAEIQDALETLLLLLKDKAGRTSP